MKNRENNLAFIDSQNMYKGTQRDLKWELDWNRFRVYLKDKYNVSKAYLFIEFIPEHNDIYDELQQAGFISDVEREKQKCSHFCFRAEELTKGLIPRPLGRYRTSEASSFWVAGLALRFNTLYSKI